MTSTWDAIIIIQKTVKNIMEIFSSKYLLHFLLISFLKSLQFSQTFLIIEQSRNLLSCQKDSESFTSQNLKQIWSLLCRLDTWSGQVTFPNLSCRFDTRAGQVSSLNIKFRVECISEALQPTKSSNSILLLPWSSFLKNCSSE